MAIIFSPRMETPLYAYEPITRFEPRPFEKRILSTNEYYRILRSRGLKGYGLTFYQHPDRRNRRGRLIIE